MVQGEDVTIVTYGSCVRIAQDANLEIVAVAEIDGQRIECHAANGMIRKGTRIEVITEGILTRRIQGGPELAEKERTVGRLVPWIKTTSPRWQREGSSRRPGGV